MTLQNAKAPEAARESNEDATFHVDTCIEIGCDATVVRGPCERGPARCSNCRAKRVERLLMAERLENVLA